jgi:hypothetical protein
VLAVQRFDMPVEVDQRQFVFGAPARAVRKSFPG